MARKNQERQGARAKNSANNKSGATNKGASSAKNKAEGATNCK